MKKKLDKKANSILLVSKPVGQQGFTLIELLIAIFLVSVGFVGIIAFFNSNLQSQFDAKKEIIAAGLGQEATELVRNIVDYNYLNSDPGGWYDEIIDKTDTTKYCKGIDREILFADKYRCKTKAKKKTICFDSSNGIYTQTDKNNACNGAGTSTEFDRELEISVDPPAGDLDNGACLKVIATVGWPNSNNDCKSDILNCSYKTSSTEIICKPRQ